MKVKGYIREQPVATLIDSGATHNFISRDLVSKLSLSKEKTSSYGITLGSRDSIAKEGICRGVRLRLQGIDIVADFLPLKLGSLDVILGVQWLESLGTIYSNWRSQIMKFRMGENTITLQGDPSLDKSLVCFEINGKNSISGENGSVHGVESSLSYDP